MTEKIKAINPEIIVSGCAEKPYYQIKYYDTADKRYHIGYGSYCYGNVIEWLKEYFEPIQADEQPVVHGYWIRFKEHDSCYIHMRCSACSAYWSDPSHSDYFRYCPNCGAKMDEEEHNNV